jgi:hypothetical protein
MNSRKRRSIVPGRKARWLPLLPGTKWKRAIPLTETAFSDTYRRRAVEKRERRQARNRALVQR